MTLLKRKSKSSPLSRKPMHKRRSTRKARPKAREVALAAVKDDLSKYLRLAEHEEILITRHGRPAGVLIGFGSDDDWFEYRLEHHPEFLRRVAKARAEISAGRGIPLDNV